MSVEPTVFGSNDKPNAVGGARSDPARADRHDCITARENAKGGQEAALCHSKSRRNFLYREPAARKSIWEILFDNNWLSGLSHLFLQSS
jgi:hypothetical protein